VTAHSDNPGMGGLTQVDLTPVHAAAGFQLSSLIGWNQAAGDWDYVLAHGDGVGLLTPDGDLAATAMALPYDRFAWICMVLVRPEYRRRGLATTLMNAVIERQEKAGRVPGLDATPDGREVYRRIGFQDSCQLGRFRAEQVLAIPTNSSDMDIRPLTGADLERIASVDRQLFGADRLPLLHHLKDRVPTAGLGAWRQGELAGYVLARDGREATQVGPLAASDDTVAEALAAAAFGCVKGPVYIDAADDRSAFKVWLEGRGFALQRPYFRMYRGQDTGFDDPAWLYAIAGPELA
jgi:GNAT superfamily N-acetyltransferase